jgi:hypothetical protein
MNSEEKEKMRLEWKLALAKGLALDQSTHLGVGTKTAQEIADFVNHLDKALHAEPTR